MLNKEQEKQLIHYCQSLVQIRSYSGQEALVAQALKDIMAELGFDEIRTDRYGDVLGKIKGNQPGNVILLDGHMDTVPVTDPSVWSQDPFGGKLTDGKIYGRGTTDMKGAVASMAYAAALFAKSCNHQFAGEIWVAGVVHEECFEGVAAREISKIVNPGYVVIGEASELNLKIGQRGRGEIVVETYGKPAHSANPQHGINAVYKMAKLIEKITTIPLTESNDLGKGILELTDIQSSPYPGASVVPELCRATYDRRLLVGETPDSVLEPIREIIRTLEKEDPQFKGTARLSKGAETCYTGETIDSERFFPGWCFEKEDAFVKASYENLQKAGLIPEITHYSFCTNGSHYGGEKGCKTLGFGPSRENLAHVVDEYIEVDQLLKSCTGYISIIDALLKVK